MSTSTHAPVHPADHGSIVDRGRAAIGTVLHVPSPPASNGNNGGTPPSPIVHRVVDPVYLGALVPPSATGPARLTDLRMTATLGWLPVGLAVSTVVAMYALADVKPELVSVLAGVAGGLVAWVSWSAATRDEARASRANPRSYGDLVGRMTAAESTIECLVAAGRLAPDAAPVVQLGVLKAHVNGSPADGDWASGIGYVNAWRDLHRIEEALIDVAGAEELEGILRCDEQRVAGSKLDRKDGFVRKLLDEARKGLNDKSDGDLRPRLHAIRAAVNDFRDSRFEALVRNRMHIDQVSFLLGLTAWALLCLAILGGVTSGPVTWAAVLYLTGAATGLFTQLRSGVSESLEDVFGYGHSSLRQIVLLSGLAGVAGVFLATVAGAATTGGTQLPVAGALPFSALGVITAAAFGLAPGTLTDRLNGWAKKNIRDLESTTTASGGQATQP